MKKLEETFNLPTEVKEKAVELKKEAKKEIAKDIISPTDIEDHDEKMDHYADTAFQYAKDIFDLGMDIEPKYGADLFSAASNMMKVALDSKNAKMEKKLKLYELELKRQKQEFEQNKNGIPIQQDDSGYYATRGDILDED